MGYRSDVALALTNEQFGKLINSVDDETATLIAEAKEAEKDGWVLCIWTDVKWHDGYKEVDAINHFLDALDEEHYDYHIMGEESDDYTHKGNILSPFALHLQRQLN